MFLARSGAKKEQIKATMTENGQLVINVDAGAIQVPPEGKVG